jgi:hypothetical protein
MVNWPRILLFPSYLQIIGCSGPPKNPPPPTPPPSSTSSSGTAGVISFTRAELEAK